MRNVVYALLPVAVFAVYSFGLSALMVIGHVYLSGIDGTLFE
jgi:hypothetical protein